MKMAGLDALPMLEAMGINAKFVHFTSIFPLEPKVMKRAFRGSKVLVMVENNSTAQFAGLVREQSGMEMDFHLLKYDGRPFFPEQIAEEVAKLKAAGYQGSKEIRVLEKEDLEYYNPQRHGL